MTLEVQSARGDAQTQLQQINAMTQAGADIILAWPISPTALNRAVRAACQKGVTFVTWDAEVTEPCSYHVGIDQEWAGAGPAEWLAQKLQRGNIIFMGGIPGTMVDTRRNAAAKGVFGENPFAGIMNERRLRACCDVVRVSQAGAMVAGAKFQRWKPTKDSRRQMAPDRTAGLIALRSDARDRRRHQDGNLSSDPPLHRSWRRRAFLLHRNSGTGEPLRSGHGDLSWSHR